MKNKFFPTILVLLICILVCFSGCTTYDKEISVVFKTDEDTIYHVANISIFKNQLIPELASTLVPTGQEFAGWQISGQESEELLPDKGLITVKYINEVIGKTEKTVVMHPVFKEKIVVNYDLVVGWYNLTATSGMSTEIASNYETALKKELDLLGKGEMSIDIRPYEGNVSATGALILADNDVDILIGWGQNLVSKGGVETVDRADSIKLGTVEGRYIDLISEKELAKTIFDWTVANSNTLFAR